jgi:heptaprenyl diphosphate synthase
MKTRRLTTLALLTASALILFVVEQQIPLPVPLPGVKLGLANVVTLVTLWLFGRRDAATVLFLRILLGNFVVGNLSAMLYSMAGGILCYLVMSLLRPLFSDKQVWLLSMFGAMAHNAGQLGAAVFVTGTPSLVLVFGPFLLIAGMSTGFFTGWAAQALLAHGKKLGLGGKL